MWKLYLTVYTWLSCWKCRHFIPGPLPGGYAAGECGRLLLKHKENDNYNSSQNSNIRNNNHSINAVPGYVPLPSYTRCVHARRQHACGPSGRWFRPRNSNELCTIPKTTWCQNQHAIAEKNKHHNRKQRSLQKTNKTRFPQEKQHSSNIFVFPFFSSSSFSSSFVVSHSLIRLNW